MDAKEKRSRNRSLSSRLSKRVKGAAAHLGYAVGGHALAGPCVGICATAYTAVKGNSTLVLLTVAVACSVTTTIMLFFSLQRQTPTSRRAGKAPASDTEELAEVPAAAPERLLQRRGVTHGMGMLLAWLPIVFALPPVVGELQRPGIATIPIAAYQATINDVSRPVTEAESVLANMTFRLREQLSSTRSSMRPFRVELTVFDPELKALRPYSPFCMQGLPLDVRDRIFPVAELTPSGGTSVAGEAYRTRQPQYVEDGSHSNIMKHFDDMVDQLYGPSRCVLSIPILDSRNPKGSPLAVLSIASTLPSAIRPQDRDVIDRQVEALSAYINRCNSEIGFPQSRVAQGTTP